MLRRNFMKWCAGLATFPILSLLTNNKVFGKTSPKNKIFYATIPLKLSVDFGDLQEGDLFTIDTSSTLYRKEFGEYVTYAKEEDWLYDHKLQYNAIIIDDKNKDNFAKKLFFLTNLQCIRYYPF